MIRNKTHYSYQLIFLVLLLYYAPEANAQESCGFGCLGLSSAFAGYSTQNFDASGINASILKQFPNSEPDFDNLKGFRLGINLFRAEFDDFFFTAKATYQFLKEEKDFSENGPEVTNIRLLLNHWSVGLDFGIPVSKHIDWKILEAGMKFYHVDYKKELSAQGIEIESDVYETDATQIGYYIGSGVLFHLVRDYVSLELTALYNGLQVDEVKNDEGTLDTDGNNFIDSGGFGGAVQLNLGVPL